MLIFCGIEADELHGMTLVPEAEEGELLIQGLVDVISLEMVVERATEGIVIMVAGNCIIP